MDFSTEKKMSFEHTYHCPKYNAQWICINLCCPMWQRVLEYEGVQLSAGLCTVPSFCAH